MIAALGKLPNLRNVRSNRWGLATQSDDALIENMCQSPNRRPYHLINTNVVLVDSLEAKYRGRGGDSFVVSPLYCGSDATGWRKSDDYMKSAGRGMTLPTAMAISARKIPDDAFERYVALGTSRSYKTLAEEYGVTKRAVTKCAAREGWTERLDKIEREARDHTDQRITESLEEMHERHLKTLKAMHARALSGLVQYPLTNGMDAMRAAA